jgi:hypothetical protein
MLAVYGLVTLWMGFLTEKDWNMDDEEGEVDKITLARENAFGSSHPGLVFPVLLISLVLQRQRSVCVCMLCRRHGARLWRQTRLLWSSWDCAAASVRLLDRQVHWVGDCTYQSMPMRMYIYRRTFTSAAKLDLKAALYILDEPEYLSMSTDDLLFNREDDTHKHHSVFI